MVNISNRIFMKTCRLYLTFLTPLFLLFFPLHLSLMEKTNPQEPSEKKTGLQESTAEFCKGLGKLYDCIASEKNDTKKIDLMTTQLLGTIYFDKSFDPNSSFGFDSPCLSYVFSNVEYQPFREIALALLRHQDINPNKPDPQKRTPLMVLILFTRNMQNEWIRLATEQLFQCAYFDINLENDIKESALYLSVTDDNFIIADMILNDKRLIITKNDYTYAKKELKKLKKILKAEEKISEKTLYPSFEKKENWLEKQKLCDRIVKQYKAQKKQKKSARKKKKNPKPEKS
jgi:hypothetical protein